MAGVKQFDETQVLDRIMALFWERGYEATSIDDLVAATGIKRGSLYNAFGGKEEMFRKAFERYGQTVGGAVRGKLEGEDPREAIRAWLDAHLARMAEPGNPRGCLATNACLEVTREDGLLGRLARENMMTAETAIYRTLLRAQKAGYLRPGQDLRALARFLNGTVRGMALLHKATGDLSAARDMAEVAMSIFDRATQAAGEADGPSRP